MLSESSVLTTFESHIACRREFFYLHSSGRQSGKFIFPIGGVEGGGVMILSARELYSDKR
jgi:hypothetical protein